MTNVKSGQQFQIKKLENNPNEETPLASNNSNKQVSKKNHSKNPGGIECCNLSFVKEARFRSHMRSAHKVTSAFACLLCNVKFNTTAGMKIHLKNVHEKFSCKVCLKTFQNKRSLQSHSLNKHSKSVHQFRCNFCPKTFAKTGFLERHLKTEHEKNEKSNDFQMKNEENQLNSFQLDDDFESLKPFPNKESLHNISLDMPNQSDHQFSCNICVKTFAKIGLLERHFETDHNNKKSVQMKDKKSQFQIDNFFDCEMCKQKFQSRNIFEWHKLSEHSLDESDLSRDKFYLDSSESYLNLSKIPFNSSSLNLSKISFNSSSLNLSKSSLISSESPFSSTTFENESLSNSDDIPPSETSRIKGAFWCDFCGKIFASKKFFEKHQKSVHKLETVTLTDQKLNDDKAKIGCQNCPKMFDKRIVFENHLKAEHDNTISLKIDSFKSWAENSNEISFNKNRLSITRNYDSVKSIAKNSNETFFKIKSGLNIIRNDETQNDLISSLANPFSIIKPSLSIFPLNRNNNMNNMNNFDNNTSKKKNTSNSIMNDSNLSKNNEADKSQTSIQVEKIKTNPNNSNFKPHQNDNSSRSNEQLIKTKTTNPFLQQKVISETTKPNFNSPEPSTNLNKSSESKSQSKTEKRYVSVRSSSGFKCPICTKVFHHKGFYDKHQRTVHKNSFIRSELPHSGKWSGPTDHNKPSIVTSKNKEKDESEIEIVSDFTIKKRGIFRCGICGESLSNPTQVSVHMRTRHMETDPLEMDEPKNRQNANEMTFSCKFCRKTFESPFQAARHVRTEHSMKNDHSKSLIDLKNGSINLKRKMTEDSMKNVSGQSNKLADTDQSNGFKRKSEERKKERTESDFTAKFNCKECGKICHSLDEVDLHTNLEHGPNEQIDKVETKEQKVIETFDKRNETFKLKYQAEEHCQYKRIMDRKTNGRNDNAERIMNRKTNGRKIETERVTNRQTNGRNVKTETEEESFVDDDPLDVSKMKIFDPIEILQNGLEKI